MKNTAVIRSKGQIVIPSELRKRYRLKEGTTVVFQEDSGRLVLEPRSYEALFALRGTLSHLPLEEELQKLLWCLPAPPSRSLAEVVEAASSYLEPTQTISPQIRSLIGRSTYRSG
jgi:AbrB family looped-hinge helix DNA binding protein